MAARTFNRKLASNGIMNKFDGFSMSSIQCGSFTIPNSFLHRDSGNEKYKNKAQIDVFCFF